MTRNHQGGQVRGLAREVAGSLNLGDVVRGVCSAAHAIVSEQVVVWLRSDDDGHLYAASDSEAENMDASGQEPIELGAGNVRRAARFGRTQGLVTSSLVDGSGARDRSEEHTSELQSLMRNSYAVFCLKKKLNTT